MLTTLAWPALLVAVAPRSADAAAPAPPPDRASEEGALVRRARSGEGAAFRRLVEPHLAMLFRLAARTCRGDAALAEDAVQEALTVAWGELHRYQPGTSLRAFLAAIAVQRAHTLRRAERRRAQREETSEAPASTPGPHRTLEARELGQRLEQALATLSPRRREVVLLRLDAGLSHAEVAQALGTTEGAARVLTHQALKELRAVLAELAPGDAAEGGLAGPRNTSGDAAEGGLAGPRNTSGDAAGGSVAGPGRTTP